MSIRSTLVFWSFWHLLIFILWKIYKISGPFSYYEKLAFTYVHFLKVAKAEWQRQKDQENATNPAIDAIMEMIGLEDVKNQVLKIKSKVDTALRQGTDMKKERLGLVLLGNPGTGMLGHSY